MTCGFCSFQWCWLCNSIYTPDHYKPYNPFGCPGQQFSRERKSCPRRALECTLFILLLLLLGPLILIFALPCYCAFYGSMIPYFVCKNHCFFALICVLFLPILGFALGLGANAIFIPFAILIVIPAIIVKNIQKKIQIDRTSSMRINEIAEGQRKLIQLGEDEEAHHRF
mmetsp:Transcript_16470/g.11834  ORF Transcript_16470/g.11834 Transcript_16470/m.11834 type:complete len:169 (-) Transcript_16470:8-514(-)